MAILVAKSRSIIQPQVREYVSPTDIRSTRSRFLPSLRLLLLLRYPFSIPNPSSSPQSLSPLLRALTTTTRTMGKTIIAIAVDMSG